LAGYYKRWTKIQAIHLVCHSIIYCSLADCFKWWIWKQIILTVASFSAFFIPRAFKYIWQLSGCLHTISTNIWS